MWKKVNVSNYPDFVVWDDTDELIGIVKSEFVFTQEDGVERKGWVIETDKDEVAVGQSARLNLSGLVGKNVRIVNKGFIRLKNGRRARDFDVYYEDNEDKIPF